MSRGNVGVKKRDIAQLVGNEESDLRDKIAIAALQGLLSYGGWAPEGAIAGEALAPAKSVSEAAYKYADAMLEARNG